ncbi:hypothetical protein [Sorangium sp. So ce854]|uniref:hypothetical protein n=1 Tax=Sorangium sp. So ce854 TaxID=3133322 RepID=UPI003F619018
MDTVSEADQRRFEDACQQMGKLFVKRGHTLIVGTDDPLDADYHFVRGANEVPGKHAVIVSRPDGDRRPTPYEGDRRTKLKNIDFRYTRRKGEWTVALVHALAEADVLLVIGGRDAVMATGYSAEALKKPVLAIPSFDGSAQKIWEEVRKYYSRCRVEEHDQGALSEVWHDGTAEVAVKSAELLAKNTPFKSNGHQTATGMAIASVVLIGLWVALLRRPWALSKDIAFYAMLTVAALLGTSLRGTLRVVRNEVAYLESKMLINEATAGILVAFGFALLYLAGGIVITGDIVALTEDKDFMRVAITMSVLGFASAYLLHESATNLQDRLLERVKNGQKYNR